MKISEKLTSTRTNWAISNLNDHCCDGFCGCSICQIASRILDNPKDTFFDHHIFQEFRPLPAQNYWIVKISNSLQVAFSLSQPENYFFGPFPSEYDALDYLEYLGQTY